MNGVIPPFPTIAWDEKPHQSNSILYFKQAEENGEYNKAVLYSIISKKVNYVRKYINGQIEAPIKQLAELYISLKVKKDVPSKKRVQFGEAKAIVSEYISAEDWDALMLSFSAAYQDALTSLSGAIKQIAGDLE